MSLREYDNKELKRQVLEYLRRWLAREKEQTKKDEIEELIRGVEEIKA